MHPMKRQQLIGLAAALVVIAGVAGLYFYNTRVPTADALPARMAAGLERMRTVQGRLTLRRGDITLEHELWVERPLRMRTEIEAGPEQFRDTIVVLNDEEAWVYVPALNLATVTDRNTYRASAEGETGAATLDTLAEDVLRVLEGEADVQVVGVEEVAGRPALRVQIITPAENNPFGAGQMTVWLDRRFYYPLAIQGDNGFELRFQFVRFNEAIDPATFVFVPPPGAAVRRLGG